MSHPPGRVPAGLAVLAGIGVVFLALPVVALVQRAPWSRLASLLGSGDALTALRLSLVCSVLATAVAVVVGVPLAWILARVDFPLKSALRALAVMPVVLPPVVGGVALLLAFGRRGLMGPVLSAVGVRLPFTTAGAVLAEAFVALPFLVLAAEAGFRSTDAALEEMAAAFGAGRWRTFVSVTLPTTAPALGAGAVLCWARALGEFGATITFAGSFPGRTETLPLAVYASLDRDPEAAVALSLVLLAISLVLLAVVGRRWAFSR